jgi:hypothetical protein
MDNNYLKKYQPAGYQGATSIFTQKGLIHWTRAIWASTSEPEKDLLMGELRYIYDNSFKPYTLKYLIDANRQKDSHLFDDIIEALRICTGDKTVKEFLREMDRFTGMLSFEDFKKGDDVYYVYPWNYNGWGYPRKTQDTDIICISGFEITAAGKSIVRFKWIEGNQNRKTHIGAGWFDQAFYFKSKDEAEKFAQFAWEQDAYKNENLSVIIRSESYAS